MTLPKNERQVVGTTNFMKGWIYGQPFSGKTTFLDKSPDPFNLNTDGNTKYVTMQRIFIRDEVTTTGRITNRKFAWEVFKDTIEELEKGSDFKTIIVDLVEDTREMCRLYMYDKLNIQHESDAGYGKGWDIIKTEYLSTMRRLLNLDYNIFLVSHEDISKDLTMRSGDKITKIAPNIQELIANKLAGMVDFVARVIVKDDGSRVLSFKHNEVTFGGGRLGIRETEIPLEWSELEKVYKETVSGTKVAPEVTETTKLYADGEVVEEVTKVIELEGMAAAGETLEGKANEIAEEGKKIVEEPAPATKRRRKKRVEETPNENVKESTETPSENVEAPKRKRRKRGE